MANPEHLAKLKKGVKAWNRWREANPGLMPDLADADLVEVGLQNSNLTGANLYRANLTEADLTGAHLGEADLGVANLNGADLAGANLTGANLTDANLNRANLSEADLSVANLRGADFSGADLTSASVGYTIFADTDLSNVKGWDGVTHLGPSTIGIDTIYRSQGKIPHIFLRGAGVPDNFIEYMASLVGTGIEFYSLFISYSHDDEEFAERLHADLQANGVRCWYAPEDMPGGKKLHREIDEAIRMHDKLLLILSAHSMASEWVMTEISKARKREVRDGRQVLFPIRLCPFEALRDWECFDADTGKDSAREIREYFIPDFSNWKDHDAYQASFNKLIKDLRAKTSTTSA